MYIVGISLNGCTVEEFKTLLKENYNFIKIINKRYGVFLDRVYNYIKVLSTCENDNHSIQILKLIVNTKPIFVILLI